MEQDLDELLNKRIRPSNTIFKFFLFIYTFE